MGLHGMLALAALTVVAIAVGVVGAGLPGEPQSHVGGATEIASAAAD